MRISWNVFVVVVLFRMIVCTDVCSERKKNDAIFHRARKGRRLENSQLKKVSTLSDIECGLQCLQETRCQSVNFGINLNSNMEHDCELNEDKASTNFEDVSKNNSYVYYEMLGDCRALGSSKDYPGKNCKEIKQRTNTRVSRNYWIKPNANASFLAYCDMQECDGGWTMVYRYKFTNYSFFTDQLNAVTPRPNWPAPTADVSISREAPSKDKFGAVPFEFWTDIGDEFLIRSNINDWYQCNPEVGNLLRNETGSISCNPARTIGGNCSHRVVPDDIQWEDGGPILRDENNIAIYRFDGSTSVRFPVHNWCKGNVTNHMTGVPGPYGEILIR